MVTVVDQTKIIYVSVCMQMKYSLFFVSLESWMFA